MVQSAGIVPSNASPRPPERDLGPSGSSSQASAAYAGTELGSDALQNTNINQATCFGFSDHDQPRFPMPYVARNTFQRYPQQQYAQLHSQVDPRSRYTWPSWSQPYSGQTITETELNMDEESRRLYARVQSCEQYRKYRERQSKVDKDDSDHKWPENLEEAFFRALVRYPPMGRGKQLHKEKQHGRNELIADFIKELTGESRNRKQVSSHIQVLKPFFAQDAQVMKYFSSKDIRPHLARMHGYSFGSDTKRRSSGYPVVAPLRAVRSELSAVSADASRNILKRRDDPGFFQPVELHMFTQKRYKKSSGQQEAECLHTYTHSAAAPMETDLEMPTWQRFGEDYPILSMMHAHQRLDCNILVAEASLAFPVESFKVKNNNDGHIEVGISFRCTSFSEIQVKCRFSFYQSGKILDFEESTGESHHSLLPCDQVGIYETWLNFGSKFWARTLSTLDQRLRETRDVSNFPREDVKAQIRDITMIEEVFLPVKQSYERILVMHWTFRLSSTTKGRATWRKLLLPMTRDETRQEMEERADSMKDDSIEANESPPTLNLQSQHSIYSPFGYTGSSLPTPASATWPVSMGNPTFQQNAGAALTPYGGIALEPSGGDVMNQPHTFTPTFGASSSDIDLSTTTYPPDSSLQVYSQQWPNNLYRYDGQPNTINPIYTAEAQDEKHDHTYENWTGFLESQSYRGDHYPQPYGDGNE